MSAAWFRAAHPAPDVGVCLGMRLRPYCLGHEFLLQLQDSALARDNIDLDAVADPIRTLQEVALAVLICSQTYEAGLKSLRSSFTTRFVLRAWSWLLRRRRLSIPSALITFAQYRQSGLWFPETNRPAHGRALGSPWQFRMLGCLMNFFRYTESEALNMPLSKASALYASWLDHEGNISLWTEQDEVLFDKLEKMEAEGKWD